MTVRLKNGGCIVVTATGVIEYHGTDGRIFRQVVTAGFDAAKEMVRRHAWGVDAVCIIES